MEKLSEQFKKEILPRLKKETNKSNYFQVPRLEKVVISVGIGDFKEDKGAVEKISNEIAKITGRKPKINLSKKAVSAFKLRIGQPVGLTVTLRGEYMYDFINRLVNIALPRVRDFRGLKNEGFDGRGNYSIGMRDYSIFPEIRYEEITVNFGLQINIKTTANNDKDAQALLKSLGFPFAK